MICDWVAHLGDHVVNEAVLVPDAQLLELLLVALRLIDLLEDLQEAPVIALEDGVLRAAQCMQKHVKIFAISLPQQGLVVLHSRRKGTGS